MGQSNLPHKRKKLKTTKSNIYKEVCIPTDILLPLCLLNRVD